jgi:hypothetical protein
VRCYCVRKDEASEVPCYAFVIKPLEPPLMLPVESFTMEALLYGVQVPENEFAS